MATLYFVSEYNDSLYCIYFIVQYVSKISYIKSPVHAKSKNKFLLRYEVERTKSCVIIFS